MARPTGRLMREEILDGATTLIQQNGVNGFSYGSLAAQLGVKSPSIHHHFRTKELLITEVVRRYRLTFAESRDAISADGAGERIRSYAELFTEAAVDDRLCLCGVAAADWRAIGGEPRAEVERFFNDQISWLTAQLDDGARTGEFRSDIDGDLTARSLLAGLEGAMLLGRAGDVDRMPSVVVEQLLMLLTVDA